MPENQVIYFVWPYVIVIVHYIRIYGSKPPRTRAKPRGQGWFKHVAINSYIVDNKCYIPTGMKNACYLSYLITFDTTSYQSQEPKDKLVRMTQPVLSL